MNSRRVIVVLATLLGVAAFAAPPAAAAPQTITVAPATNTAENCFPFGEGKIWTPYLAWVYKDIPAFQLRPGDTLAFDTNVVNNANVELAIAMAPTTSNGSDVPAERYTQIVSNAQTPANATGDTTVGDFELRFTAEHAFAFAGGGLIILFSDPSAAYAADPDCTVDLVGGSSSDTTGFFVERAFADSDGVPPWDNSDAMSIGAFQIVPYSNTFTLGKPILNKKKGTAQLPVTIPGAGVLSLAGGGVAAQTVTIAAASSPVSTATTVKLLVKPKGKKKRKLKDTGKTRVSVAITYTPSLDVSTTQPKKVKLKQR